MLKGLLDCKNLFSPHYHEENDKLILKYFQKLKGKKLHCVVFRKNRKFEKPKISYLLEKTLLLSILFSKFKNEDEKLFKEEESI